MNISLRNVIALIAIAALLLLPAAGEVDAKLQATGSQALANTRLVIFEAFMRHT